MAGLDGDTTENDEATSAPMIVVAEMQITCRVVQHDCHPVRLLARCHRPLLHLDRFLVRFDHYLILVVVVCCC